MNKLVSVLCLIALLASSCSQGVKEKKVPLNLPEWSSKTVSLPTTDSLSTGKSYLPVYSQVYSISEMRTLNLTVMVSLRNTNDTSKVYLTKANYYNSAGELIRNYINGPVALNPLETRDIVINEDDDTGGTGGNFVFEWHILEGDNPPLFQAVMNSTLGQQGLSFTTEAISIK